MEIKVSENTYKIFLLNRLRTILVLLVRIPLPILAALIIIQFIITRNASALKVNSEIFFYPLSFIVGAALLSTPFLLYFLVKEKRRAWIKAFLVMVVLPFLLAFLIANDNIFNIPWMIDLMVPFYFYCYLLKHTVGEWIEEYEGQKMRKERKREEARRMKEEERWM
jgi:hypothetical protein